MPQGQGTGRMPVVGNGNTVFFPLVAAEMLTQQECAHVWVIRLLSCPTGKCLCPSDQVFVHTGSSVRREELVLTLGSSFQREPLVGTCSQGRGGGSRCENSL